MILMPLSPVASFMSPEQIGTNPQSVLWILPLLMAIVVIYKTTKIQTITAAIFLKETASLFLSILVFMIVVALVLHAAAYLISM